VPNSSKEVDLLACSLGFEAVGGSAADVFLDTLNHYRSRVRGIIERVYIAPGYLRLNEREEELAHLLSDRMPKQRVRELLSQYGFRDIDKAWQNIRLLALGPAGHLLPPGDRRIFLEFAFPMLEVFAIHRSNQALRNLGFHSERETHLLCARRIEDVPIGFAKLRRNWVPSFFVAPSEYFDSIARVFTSTKAGREMCLNCRTAWESRKMQGISENFASARWSESRIGTWRV
jgi:hypothetical protein